MIEQGLVMLIDQGISSVISGVPGGSSVQLAKDQLSQSNSKAWTYRCFHSEPTYVLEGQDGFTAMELQIDCHGYTAADAQALARAIDGVLRGGFAGTLSDPDHTLVQGIFRQGPFLDGFSDSNRSFVRTLEYLVNYNQI
jgi:hypothetical protein